MESDTGDKMVRFPREASGDVPPKAVLHTPHRVYNLAADESKQEIFATVEFPPQVVVYRKDASGEEQAAADDSRATIPGLDAPHGIAVDEKDRLVFVNTWGHHSDVARGGHREMVSARDQGLRAGCQRRCQAAARDYRRQDATGLAGGDEVQSGKWRSVRGQRHRPVRSGLRQCAQGAWRRSAGAE